LTSSEQRLSATVAFSKEDDSAHDLALFGANGRGGKIDRNTIARRSDQGAIAGAHDLFFDVGLAQGIFETRATARVNQMENLGRALAHRFLDPPPGQLFGARIHEENLAAAIRGEQAIRDTVESIRKPESNSRGGCFLGRFIVRRGQGT
jgi:hypothetical protein